MVEESSSPRDGPSHDEEGRLLELERRASALHELLREKELALEASELRYRRLADATTDYIYTARIQDGRVVGTRHGPGCVAITGYRSEEFSADPYLWYRMIAAEDRPLVDAHLRRLLEGEPGAIEHRIVRKDGQIRWVRNTPILERDATGRVLSYDGLVRDVTERRLAEDSLRASEQRYRQLFDAGGDAVFVHEVTPDGIPGRFLEANDTACRQLGYRREELLTMTPDAINAPWNEAEMRPIFARLASGEPVTFERTHIARDGRHIDVEIHARPFEYRGAPAVIALVRDITDRKRIQKTTEALRNRTTPLVGEAFFRALMLELTRVLGVRHGLIGRIMPEDAPRMRTVCACTDDRIVDNYEFELAGTPCEGVLHQRLSFHPSGVRDAFPNARYLHDMNVESYLGCQLVSSAGAALGVMCLMHDRPQELSEIAETTLTLYAARVSAEIERSDAEAALRQSGEQFKALIERTHTGYVILDLHGKVIDANQEYVRLSGHASLDDIAHHHVMEWTAPEDQERFMAELARCVQVGQGRDLMVHVIDGQGRRIPLELHATCLGVGASRRIASLCRDITERSRAQQALRESEARFRDTFEQAAVGIFHVQLDGKFLRVNQRHCDILGYTREEILQLEQSQMIAPEDVANLVDIAGRLQAREISDGSSETRLRRKDGSIVWANVTLSICRSEAGELPYYIGVVQDVTERRRAERALRLMHFAVDHASDACHWVGRDARLMYVNDAACAALGYTREELLRLTIYDVDLDVKRETWDVNWETMSRQGSLTFESRERTKDGRVFPVEVLCNYLEYEGDCFLCTYVRDVTARRQAERALRESENKFRALVENNPDIVVRFDREHRALYVNPAFTSELGISARDALGRAYRDGGGSSEFGEGFDAMIRRVFDSGREQTFEASVPTPTGVRHYLSRGVPEFAADGSVSTALFIHRNISDRKRAEQEQERLRAQLLQAQKMEAVGRLAGGVAHDFNNLLTGILGFSELALLDIDHNSEAGQCLVSLNEVVDQCKGLTQQILAFSRQQVLTLAVLDMNAVVLAASKMLRRIIGEHIDVRIHLEPDIGHVRADGSQLQQILVNLAVNARDAMPRGGALTITTSRAVLAAADVRGAPEVPPGDYVLLTVSDAGVGMDRETLTRVFEPFFTTKQLGRGTGLGLATVYGIVKQHGGLIEVQSATGTGTIFKVYLPRVEAVEAGDGDARVHPAVSGSNETVLVVEDDVLVRDLTVRRLSAHGYNVLVAPGPLQALALVRQHSGPIDIVVTDVVMPDMNGRQLYAELCRIRPGLRVLFMSGYPGDTLAQHGGELDEGLHFVQKPFTIADLTRHIRHVLDGQT